MDTVQAQVRKAVDARLATNVQSSVWASVGAVVADSVEEKIHAHVRAEVEARIWDSLRDTAFYTWAVVWEIVQRSVSASVWAYRAAPSLTLHAFYDVYLAPNDAHALAHLNELVSGYWFGEETALLVRRPQLLARDEQGRLHNAKGKCLRYRDGWGFYAWHGVRVPEKVILMPHALTSEDWQNEESAEARRVIQERMSSRFLRG